MAPEDRLNAAKIARINQYYEDARSRSCAVANLAMLWLKSMTILSGGGIIALFTLLGKVETLTVSSEYLWLAFSGLVVSIVCVMAATFFGYMGQDYFYRSEFRAAENVYNDVIGDPERTDTARGEKNGKLWHIPALLLAMLSLASFAFGSACALIAVRPQQPLSAGAIQGSCNSCYGNAQPPTAAPS